MLHSMRHLLKCLRFVWAALALAGIFEEASAQDGEKKEFQVSEFTFRKPDSWRWETPRSSMRKAQLSIPGKKGAEKGEAVFFYFGAGNSGGKQSNIDRWLQQFQEPKEQLRHSVTSSKIDKTPVTFVRAEGTYLSGPPLGRKVPKQNFALLGAIVEGGQGFVFIKLTGPKTVVFAAENDFKTMVTSAK